MNRLFIAALLACAACAHTSSLFTNRDPDRGEIAADSMYWEAVHQLAPSNKNGSRDSALVLLNAYLGSPAKLHHIAEASALAGVTRDAQQLARVQAALQQARDDAKTASANGDRARAEGDSKAGDDAVKEIARLKEELARANDELDRIKKRLAAPPPKP
ncbi:MAG TPA: hypothetical protein VJ867_09870 [Gemmatimonadaceae bacterium]|nr:hypothetical protein [Gemmatimonadaceae bacterium]